MLAVVLFAGGEEIIDGEEIGVTVTKLTYRKVAGLNLSFPYDLYRSWDFLYFFSRAT